MNLYPNPKQESVDSAFEITSPRTYRFQLTLTEAELSSVLHTLENRLENYQDSQSAGESVIDAHPNSHIGNIQRVAHLLDRAYHGVFATPNRCRLVYRGQRLDVK